MKHIIFNLSVGVNIFTSPPSKGIISQLYPDDGQEAAFKTLASFFDDAYNWYLSHDYDEIIKL